MPADTQSFRAIPPNAYYDRLVGIGAEYGPSFRGMQAMRRNGRELFAEVKLPQDLAAGYILHPALLDACLHPLGICLESEDAEGTGTDLFMPIGAARYAVYRDGATAGMARVTGSVASAGAQAVEADIALFDDDGALIAEVDRPGGSSHYARPHWSGCCGAAVRRPNGNSQSSGGVPHRPMRANGLAGQNWLLFADSGGVAEAVATRMRADGAYGRTHFAPGGAGREAHRLGGRQGGADLSPAARRGAALGARCAGLV